MGLPMERWIDSSSRAKSPGLPPSRPWPSGALRMRLRNLYGSRVLDRLEQSSRSLKSIPGQNVAYNYGLLPAIYKLPWGILACFFALLGYAQSSSNNMLPKTE